MHPSSPRQVHRHWKGLRVNKSKPQELLLGNADVEGLQQLNLSAVAFFHCYIDMHGGNVSAFQ